MSKLLPGRQRQSCSTGPSSLVAELPPDTRTRLDTAWRPERMQQHTQKHSMSPSCVSWRFIRIKPKLWRKKTKMFEKCGKHEKKYLLTSYLVQGLIHIFSFSAKTKMNQTTLAGCQEQSALWFTRPSYAEVRTMKLKNLFSLLWHCFCISQTIITFIYELNCFLGLLLTVMPCRGLACY